MLLYYLPIYIYIVQVRFNEEIVRLYPPSGYCWLPERNVLGKKRLPTYVYIYKIINYII